MTESARMCGRHIHQAAHALHTVRTTALNEAGITFPQWKVLDKAPGNNCDDLIHQLVELAVDDRVGIATAIDELRKQGLLNTDDQGNLELTSHGRALCQQVSATRADLQDQLYNGITADDLTTTRRVLDQITERAKAVGAGQYLVRSSWIGGADG